MNPAKPTAITEAQQRPATAAEAGSIHRVQAGPNISLNYSLAKVIAIFTVMAGHWFTGTILWIPVTFGLFVFVFSSAYFTARKYGVSIDGKSFWREKLARLGLRYWVTLSFLAIVVGLKGGTILHWHTLVHLFGLSGVLNWLALPNRSGLGAGLWFFTLLLLFYAFYPLLAKLSKSKIRARLVAVSAAAAALFLETEVKVGHELWLTSLGFILGVVFGIHEAKMGAKAVAVCFLSFCGALFAINIFSQHREFNVVLIAAASISLSLWLSKARLVYWPAFRSVAKLEKYLLEIFLIHVYLFVHVSGNSTVDFAVSVLLVVAVAMGLNRLVEWLSPLMFKRRPGR